MIVFNLTDQAQPGKKTTPQVIKISGKAINPGTKAEVADLPLKKLSGMIYGGMIAIDRAPSWYVQARSQQRRERKAKAEDKPPKRVEVDVGVMTATVEAGPDGEFGTDDDVKKVAPRTTKPKTKKSAAKRAKKKGK